MTWGLAATLTAIGLFLFDFQNLLSLNGSRVIAPVRWRSDDFTICIPLYGSPRYFDERERIAHLKERVLVCMDVGAPAMLAFADELEAEGWRVFRTIVSVRGLDLPGPPSLVKNALDAGAVTTSVVVRMDADTYVGDDLPNAVAAFIRDGADFASVKCLVRNSRDGVVGRMQALEYEMAMLSRHFRPWLASGACFVAKTVMLREILARHSMSYLGEDVETGRIARALDMKIRHLDIRVETDAPASWRALFRQRQIWWAGNFRHLVLNLDKNVLQTPMWILYYAGLVWVGLYFKWGHFGPTLFEPARALEYLLLLLGVYVAVTLIANWQVRSRWMLAFPLYALVQAMLMPPFGLAKYVGNYRATRHAGRYQFGYLRTRLFAIPAVPARHTGVAATAATASA